MFKRLISLVMLFSVLTASAQAGTSKGLEAAFDELNYSLTVEWDQKDMAVKNAKVAEFSDRLKDLQNDGLTSSDVIQFLKSKNPQVGKEIETAFNVAKFNKMDSAHAAELMKEAVERSYGRGASWNGRASLHMALAAGVFIAAAVIIVSSYDMYSPASPAATCKNGNVVECGQECSGSNCAPLYCCY